MKIKYEFVNGDISEVEVEDSLGALLVDKESLEKYPEMRERMQSLLEQGERITPKQ